MADPGPRRVSKAYMLGLSDKPFKAPPGQPSNFKRLVSTPGGLIEWTASDGRRGTLTGLGKVRSLAQDPSKAAPETAVPELAPATAAPDTAASHKAVSNKAASNKAASNKAASKVASNKGGAEDDGVMGIAGIFDEAPAATSDKPAGNDWTEGLDKKLLEWKAHNHTKPWHIIGRELGKAKEECKERFQLIKPKDWRPAYGAKQSGAGGTDKDKQGNDKKKEAEKKEDTKNEDDGWSNNNNPAGKGSDEKESGNDGWDNEENKSENKDNQANGSRNDNSKGENEVGQAGEWGGWGGTDDNVGNNNPATGFQDWDANAGNTGDTTTKPVSQKASSNKPAYNKPASNGAASNSPHSNKPHSYKPPSNKPSADKPPSQHPSNPALPHPQPQAIYELQPDATFSASDLRLIARILQQDCSMVWERVSWRFCDKTGRKLHADLFEEKITGGVEKKSEM